jgi:hypothetical protein
MGKSSASTVRAKRIEPLKSTRLNLLFWLAELSIASERSELVVEEGR